MSILKKMLNRKKPVEVEMVDNPKIAELNSIMEEIIDVEYWNSFATIELCYEKFMYVCNLKHISRIYRCDNTYFAVDSHTPVFICVTLPKKVEKVD